MSVELDVSAHLELMGEVKKANKKIDNLYAMLVKAERRVKLIPIPAVAVAFGATTIAVLDYGAPPPNFIWELKSEAHGPADLTAALPTNITSFLLDSGTGTVGNPGTSAALGDVSSASLISWTQQYPAQSFFGSYEKTIWSPNHLRAIILGLTAGTVVTGRAEVLQSALDTTFRTREVNG